MLEIVVEPRQSFSLKQSVLEAIKSGDYNSLNDDIRDCFTEEQIGEMEDLLDSGDLGEAIDEIVNEWNGEDIDELFEAIESYFADMSIEIQFMHDEEFEETSEEEVEEEEPAEEEDFEYDDMDESEEEEEEEGEEDEEEFVDPDDDM